MNTMQTENGIMNTTREDKELLLKYLCMALPYKVKLKKYNEDSAVELYSINLEHEAIQYWSYKSGSLQIGGYGHLTRYDKLQFKPYLRSMSSITEEEIDAYTNTGSFLHTNGIPYNLVYTMEGLLFLLKNHFDIFGLIPKDLAIEIIEENNPYKQYIVITQTILDYIEKNSHNFENPIPTLGEKWIVDGEFTYSDVCGGQPVIEIHKTTGEFMRLPKSIVKVE